MQESSSEDLTPTPLTKLPERAILFSPNVHRCFASPDIYDSTGAKESLAAKDIDSSPSFASARSGDSGTDNGDESLSGSKSERCISSEPAIMHTQEMSEVAPAPATISHHHRKSEKQHHRRNLTPKDTEPSKDMYVTKRNGKREVISFDKILKRMRKVGMEVGIKINYTTLSMKVIEQLFDGISTTQIDELSAEQCASMTSIHPCYGIIAGRILISNHHKNTESSFVKTMKKIYNQTSLLHPEFYKTVISNTDVFDSICDYSRDFLFDYFGYKTLEKSYLIRIHNKVVERPQHMWLRVAIGIHGNHLEKVVETYTYMSQKYFTHATPTLFNAGTKHPQLASCFLLAMESDSIEGIYNTLKDCALISKWAGGIGLHIHNIRATGSLIHGTNGSSNGIVPMLRVFNNTAKYVDQCLEPHTYIYTLQGPKYICDITKEDKVLAADRVFYPIKKILKYTRLPEPQHIRTIDVEYQLRSMRITNIHPIWTIQLSKLYHWQYEPEDHLMDGRSPPMRSIGGDYLVSRCISEYHRIIHDLLIRKLVVPEFIESESIERGDFIGIPIPSYEQDYVQYNIDDCRFYGILLGIGVFETFSSEATIPTTKLKPETLHFITSYLIRNNIPHFILDRFITLERVKPYFIFHDPELLYRKTTNMLEEGKRIHPRMLHLPKYKIKIILSGLMEVKGEQKSYGEIEFHISPQLYLAECVRYLYLRLGILTTTDGKNISAIPPPHPNATYFKFQDFLFTPVVKNALYTSKIDTLYDLELDVDEMRSSRDLHNYTVHNGLVHNGGGKRNGSFAIYLEPWHADIEQFLQMRKNHGDEEMKARDLFYALWIPDLFMTRVKENGNWTLMCPAECSGLHQVYGEEFEALYTKYESEKRGRKTIPAREIWFKILDSQMETGTPYMLYKDACNKKSNQKNVGTIMSSNLCVAPETLVLTDRGHISIHKLEGKMVNVWNGEEFSEVKVVKTGKHQELIEVHTNYGLSLHCTKYHKFLIEKNGKTEKIAAWDLHSGDTLSVCERFPVLTAIHHQEDSEFTQNIDAKMKWLSEYCKENGFIVHRTQNLKIYANEGDRFRIALLLQTCGVLCDTSMSNTIICYCQDVEKLIEHGFEPPNLFIGGYNHTRPPMTITRIINNGRRDDTYCFQEPKRNRGIFNGIMTSQCSEIIEYSDHTETAVCNLASIALAAFVNTTSERTEASGGDESMTGTAKRRKTFDFDKLHEIARIVTYNLNRVIDCSYYPTEKTRKSNLRHRPLGIGVQGLADTFFLMGLPFNSEESIQLNRDIFETIYHAALEESCELAKIDGPYETFVGSPASEGILQFDLWGKTEDVVSKGRYDWNALKSKIREFGLRNSLLLAPMPTASTSQILGYNECIEPITSNIYSRRTLAGEFVLTNKYLMNDLIELGIWDEALKNQIIVNNGSIQSLEIIPVHIREKYKTVWEIPMRCLIDMAADRGMFICQSQSLNLWLEDPNYNTLTSMHFYAWSKGLKTGIYYLRRRAKHKAQQFTIEPEKKNAAPVCDMCSS